MPALLKKYKLNAGGLIGIVLLSIVVLLAVFAPVLPIPDPVKVDLLARMRGPFAFSASGTLSHLAGTDQLGRDLLARVLFGARVTLSIVAIAVLISAAVGVVLGLISGFFGGMLDRLLMRLVDLQLAFPLMLLALTVISVMGPSAANLIAVLALAGWVRFARIVRGEVIALRGLEFVLAARAAGASNLRIMFRHILPNVLAPILVIGTLEVARMILLESSLSFLGLGTQPPDPSWGRMLADGRSYLANAWWISAVPGVAILITVLSINLLGDY
ncbi:MAG: ABC transporter permease, partial [Desulfobacterales bacterium]|nr:ABC transporter permease [Desulfobacterales bacterium]